MNDKRAAIGIVLLLVGGLTAFFCHQKLAEYDAPLGKLKVTFSDEHSSKAAAWKTGRLGGGALAAVGLVLAGLGLTSRRG